jgi:hypothetical protein
MDGADSGAMRVGGAFAMKATKTESPPLRILFLVS